MAEIHNVAELETMLCTLIGQAESVMMATVNKNGEPEASYAPFIQVNGRFYVYLSELATHTKNLQQHPAVSLLLTEPCFQGNAFVRQRVTCSCNVAEIDRGRADYPTLLEQMEKQFGSLLKTLQSLGDFHLFGFTPTAGQFVVGFGKAYTLTWENGFHIQQQRFD